MPRSLPYTVALVAALAAGPVLAAPGEVFLKKAIAGDISEVRLGALAERKGASPGVRDFGKMLQSDHAAARDQASSLARSMDVTPPADMSREARQEYRKLDHLSGADFDREFVRYMVSDHKKDIADFEKQANSGDSKTAGLARQTLPTLRHHLETAEGLIGH